MTARPRDQNHLRPESHARARSAEAPGQAAYATTWLPGLALALAAMVSTFLMLGSVWRLMPAGLPQSVALVFPHGLGAMVFGILLLAQRQLLSKGLPIAGAVQRSDLLAGLGAVLLAYLSCYGVTVAQGMPREPSMVQLFAGLAPVDVAQVVILLLTLPPLCEELLFRHFLLAAVPFNKSPIWSGVAVLGTASLFALVHQQYQNWPTLALMFVMGVILAVARIRSGGLLLPVILHSFAVALALTGNWVWQLLGG